MDDYIFNTTIRTTFVLDVRLDAQQLEGRRTQTIAKQNQRRVGTYVAPENFSAFLTFYIICGSIRKIRYVNFKLLMADQKYRCPIQCESYVKINKKKSLYINFLNFIYHDHNKYSLTISMYLSLLIGFYLNYNKNN